MRRARLVSAVLTGLFLVTSLPSASATYSNASLKGPYSFLTNRWLSNLSDNPEASLGIVNFDGVGNFTVSFTQNSAGIVNTFTGGGTYSVAANGTGAMNVTLSGISGSATEAIVLDSGGKSFQYVQTSCTFCGGETDVEAGTAVKMGATSFSNASLKGNYELMMTKWTSDQDGNADVSVGVVTFNGAGNIKGSVTDVFAGSAKSFTFTATYSVNSDGSGSFSATANGSTITVAFVVNTANPLTSLAKGFQLLKTAESPGSTGVHTGTATKQ